MKKIFLVLITIIPIFLFSWTQTGPAGVDSRFMVIDDSTGYAYLVSRNNSLYKIDINTNTWTFIETPEPDKRVFSINALNDIIFLGKEDHILRSVNGGETWEYQEHGINFDIVPHNIKISRTEPNVVIAQIGSNIWYRSTDYGLYWFRIYNIPTPIIELSRYSPLVVAIGPHGIYKSFDNGENWTEQPYEFGSFVPNSIAIINDATFVTAGFYEDEYSGDNNVFITYDGGASWENINYGYSFGLPFGMLFYEGNVYMNVCRTSAEQNTGVFQLDIQNNSWRRIGSNFFAENVNWVIYGYNQKIFAASFFEDIFSVDIHSDNTVNYLPTDIFEKTVSNFQVNHSFNNFLIAKTNQVRFSDDYGETWTRIDSLYTAMDIKQSTFDPNFYIGIRWKKGIVISHDGGQNWLSSNNGISEADIILLVEEDS